MASRKWRFFATRSAACCLHVSTGSAESRHLQAARAECRSVLAEPQATTGFSDDPSCLRYLSLHLPDRLGAGWDIGVSERKKMFGGLLMAATTLAPQNRH